MEVTSPSYKGHRYPVEVISHRVWLYFRFPLSYREVEELMLERGVIVSYETVRRWCRKFGQSYANGLHRRRPRPGDKWHLDEVFIKINGEQKYLWRTVDQDGNVLDILVQNRRDKAAAGRFLRRLMTKTRAVPRVIVTDKLRSYSAAHHEVMPSVEHRSHKRLNNRAESSHQPTRQRERVMKGFRSVGGAQRFLSAFSGISPHFRPRRHLMPAPHYRAEMTVRFTLWEQRRHGPTCHGLSTGSEPGPTTPRHSVKRPHTPQRDNVRGRRGVAGLGDHRSDRAGRERLVVALRGLLSYVIGAIQLEHLGALSGPVTTAITELSPAEFPHMTETARDARNIGADQEFLGGLAILLDGLRA